MTPATSGAPDPPATAPPSDRGATAAPPARMARRMPNKIDRTAVPPARISVVSEMAICFLPGAKLWLLLRLPRASVFISVSIGSVVIVLTG